MTEPLEHPVRRKRILLEWGRRHSYGLKRVLVIDIYVLSNSILISFILYRHASDSPILMAGQGNKDWQKHVSHPFTQGRWQRPLMLSTCYLKETTQWLECLHKACATYAAWNSEVIDQTFKGAFIPSFLFFSPVFLVKAPKPLDAYDAVPDAQSSITRHRMPNSAIQREHLPLGSVFQPFEGGLLQLGVISQTIRGVDLCVVLWCHGFTCWPH